MPDWALALAGSVLVASAFVVDTRLGGGLLVLVILGLASRAYSNGLLKVGS